MSDEMARTTSTFLRALFTTDTPMPRDHLDPAFFDLALLRTALSMSSTYDADTDDWQLLELYRLRPECRLVSANPMFDENWYRASNPDVVLAIETKEELCGFTHFINYGIYEGRWPNYAMKAAASGIQAKPRVEQLDETLYLDLNPQVRAFLVSFPFVTPLEHYNSFGRRLGLRLLPEQNGHAGVSSIDLVIAEFDPAWYAKRYATRLPDDGRRMQPLEHYLTHGARAALSPNAWFEEEWYRAFYPDVRRAIAAGAVPSGFYHYVAFGRAENRLPLFDLSRALEACLPTVTEPALLRRVPGLRERLDVQSARLRLVPPGAAATGPTLWFLMPVLNPDIAFGGYQACFALMIAARAAGFEIAVLCLEEAAPNREYFVWRQKSAALRAVIAEARLYGRADLQDLSFASGDLFVAYSVWSLKLAARLAALAGDRAPFLLVQEYEPIFYENNALRALCAELYTIEHHPIINSRFLLRYLQSHRIGAFRRGRPAHRARSDAGVGIARSARRRFVRGHAPVRDRPAFTVFEHRITLLARQSASDMAARPHRVLAAYARPEAHAGRNLFEMVVLALERLCQQGLFGSEWRFIGLGALSDLPDVPLGGGHVLKLTKKMDEAEYAACMASLDIGVSMMAAPHPSVMPFEFATTGALVVTNSFENRSASELTGICGNIIPCEMRLESMIVAIRDAVRRVGGFEEREARAYRPTSVSWDAIFSPDFVGRLFGRPTREQPAPLR